MSREVFQGEAKFFGFLGANISLGGVHAFIQKVQPELNMALTVVQIVVGLFTIVHVVKKWITTHKTKNAPPGPSSS
jgi:hypothetical protein